MSKKPLFVDRSSITLVPTEAFAERLGLNEGSDPQFQVYLLPVFETEDETYDFIVANLDAIAQNEFEYWDIPEDERPEEITLEIFLTLFDIELSEMVYDLAA